MLAEATESQPTWPLVLPHCITSFLTPLAKSAVIKLVINLIVYIHTRILK